MARVVHTFEYFLPLISSGTSGVLYLTHIFAAVLSPHPLFVYMSDAAPLKDIYSALNDLTTLPLLVHCMHRNAQKYLDRYFLLLL